MKISRTLAHRLQNLIQMVMGFIEMKRDKEAVKKLREMSDLIGRQTVETVNNCDDCDYKPKDDEKP